MAKKNLANNKVILAMGVGIAAMLAMPMYANAEEGAIEPQQDPVIPTESVDETVSGEDFNDDGDKNWMAKLKYQPKSGALENSVYNLNLILNNDPDFAGFAYN